MKTKIYAHWESMFIFKPERRYVFREVFINSRKK